MKMKKNSLPALCLIMGFGIMLITSLTSCSFFGIPDYELTVTINDGVTGTPESGQHTYKDLTVFDYKYTPVNPLHTVEVISEGSQMAAEGKATIYNNMAIEARLMDIRATWDITFLNSDGTSHGTSKITFSGANILGGTFGDNLGNIGNWDAASNVINIVYINWEAYKLTGTLFKMSGTWSNGSVTGTWSATRKL